MSPKARWWIGKAACMNGSLKISRITHVRLGAAFIKIDPELVTARGVDTKDGYQPQPEARDIIHGMEKAGWIISKQQIQFKNTFLIRLDKSEDELLADMKQKTRYNIRLSKKKGVSVREAGLDELELVYEMYAETSHRDGFIIRPKDYYIDLWSSFISAGMATSLLAEVEREVVAGLMLFHFGDRSWYIYGMSTNKHREKNAQLPAAMGGHPLEQSQGLRSL